MKKILLIALMLLTCGAKAQVTITQSTFPTIGSTVVRYEDTLLVPFNPGNAGTGQSWNFTGLNADATLTYNFLDPASTADAAKFPTSNLVFNNNMLYLYLNMGTNDVKEVGWVDDASSAGGNPGNKVYFSWSPELLFMPFPSTYNTTYTDSSVGTLLLSGAALGQPMIDSIKVVSRLTRNGHFDATGSLTINSTNFSDALRHKRIDARLDSAFIKSGFLTGGQWADASQFGAAPQFVTEVIYEWYVNGQNFPVFTADMNATQDSATRTFYDPTNAKNNPLLGGAIEIYPNPASSHCFISGDMKQVHSVLFFNTLGQSYQMNFQNHQDKIEITTSALPSGVYSFQLLNNQNQILHQGKIIIKK